MSEVDVVRLSLGALFLIGLGIIVRLRTRKAGRLLMLIGFLHVLNLENRQHVAAVGRRVSTLCKGEDGLWYQLAFFQTYHNFSLPHASLRQPLPCSWYGVGEAVATLYTSHGSGGCVLHVEIRSRVSLTRSCSTRSLISDLSYHLHFQNTTPLLYDTKKTW